MAVALGNVYSAEDGSGSESTVTVPSVVLAADDVADVTVAWRENGAQTLSSVTFNGSSTGVTTITTSTGSDERVSIAKLRILGVTGTANVVATLSAGVPAIRCIVQVLTGVDQTTPTGTTDTQLDLGGATGALSGTVTLASGDLAIAAIVVGTADASGTLAANGGQNVIDAANVVGAGGDITTAVSSETGTGSVTSGYTWNGAVAGYGRLIVVPYLAGGPGQGDPHANFARKVLRPSIFTPGLAR